MPANSEDLDQTPRSAASDLGPHCLPMSPKRDARHIWVNWKSKIITKASKTRHYGVAPDDQFRVARRSLPVSKSILCLRCLISVYKLTDINMARCLCPK